jgi:hypothetical protein
MKLQKDVKTLTDLVLMKEIRDNSAAMQMHKNNLTVLQAEADRRIAAEDAKEGQPAGDATKVATGGEGSAMPI